jgi:CRP-like cAMP-binding protein
MAKPSTRASAPDRVKRGTNGHAIRNEILLSLPSNECTTIFDDLTLVDLKLHDPLHDYDKPIDFVYFPNTAMGSVLSSMEDGKAIEVGLIGYEGFIGLSVVAGFKTSPHRVITQGCGTAFRLSAELLRKALGTCPQLAQALLRFSQRFILQTTQIAACNRLHEGDERLARWLLMTQDRVGGTEMPLTQEFLGQMLGTRRASVSISASTLQKAGLITYVHGKIKIIDREGLEKASCECYDVLHKQWEKFKRESM